MVKLRMLLGAWAIVCLCILVCCGCKEGGDTIITTLPTNAAPVVIAIPDQAADEGVPFSLDLTTYISDDHDAVSSLVLAVISGGGTITAGVYDNTFATAGTYTISFIAGDTEGRTTVASFNITVTAAPNSAPTIAAIPDQAIVADQELILNLAYYLSDDNDTLADLLVVVTSGGGSINGLIYTNTWTAEGTYMVNLTVQDSGGLTTAGSFNVIVYEQPVADFTASVTAGVAPLTVNFTDLSTGGVTGWAWDFDNNGVTDSTVQNPSYQYASAGVYDVKLTVTGPGGTASVTKTSFVQVPTTVWYVDDAIVSSGTGTTWLQAFKTLEEGITAAAVGNMVLVADGTYTGASNRDLDFGGVDLTLRAYGSNCVIDCEGQDRAFYFQTAETNAAVVYGFTITDCNQPSENGGAVYCDGASPSFVNCTFIENYADTSSYYGGVFYCYGASIAVIDCTFTGNQAYEGACFYLEEGSNATITNCVFQENMAPNYAGVMYLYHSHPTVTNCLFERNMSDYGSVMWAEEYSNATFLTCTFDYNMGYDCGAIYLTYGDLKIDGCVFRGNTSYDYSAAVSAYDYTSVTISNTLFEGNSAYEEGAAIYCHDYCDGTVTNCTFTGNSSYYAIVYLDGDCGVDFSYCTFYNNVAYDYGSMYIYDSPCTIDNCNFYNNTSEYGGAMYINGNDPPTITNGTFTGNSAYEGGAIYVNTADVQLTGCTFTGNRASEYGGAIYAYGSTGTEYTLTLTNCTIDQNLCGNEAGGIYCYYYNLKATNTSISRNNSAYEYGAIYFGGYNLHTNTLELTGCTLDNNIAGYDGGAIYANYCSATISNTSVSGNMAGDEYAAVYTSNGTGRLWKWDNCTISNNLAGYGYGYYISSVDTEFTNCTIQGNMCPDNGAGLYIWQGNTNYVSLTGCLIDNNVSAEYGGGFYCYRGDLMLKNCVITNNTAGQSGGAIYGDGLDAANPFRLTMDNCLVAGNDCNEDGGAIYCIDFSLLVINNCTIADNIADYNGGGFYLNAATCIATMTDAILWSNTANATGHQIYAVGASPIAIFFSDYANATGDIIGSAVIATTASISLDPLFVTGSNGSEYYLSQIAAGWLQDSPCLDAGSDTAVNLGLDALTTRTDGITDAAVVDIGYHYKP
jgi:predicted outer membrane repeat protein